MRKMPFLSTVIIIASLATALGCRATSSSGPVSFDWSGFLLDGIIDGTIDSICGTESEYEGRYFYFGKAKERQKNP